VWIIIAIVVVAVVVSILAGENDSTSSGNSGGVDQDGATCQGCKNAAKWYRSLPWYKKAAYAAWWAYKKVQCAASGCSF
jgi:hypothetical protein